MEIQSVEIKNIKGFDHMGKSIRLCLKSGKINLLIAPNGWGKSSMVAAFNCLQNDSLLVPKDLKNRNHVGEGCSLTLDIDGRAYTADETKNEIAGVLSCQVIHCDTIVRTTTRRVGEAHIPDGYLAIQSIDIPYRVKEKRFPSYSIKKIRDEFGANGKILINRKSLFSDVNFWLKFTEEVKSALDKMQAKHRKDLLNQAIRSINHLTGNADAIRKRIMEKGILDALKADDNYKLIIDILYSIPQSEYDKFDFFYQMNQLYINNRKEIKEAIAYAEFVSDKHKFTESIKTVNTTWDDMIVPKETKNRKLRVEFPHANQISNGQRDILTFTIRLMAFTVAMKKNKKYLLLIDEIFDYLDDANMVAAQYYLSKMIQHAKETDGVELIIGIFTHLNPEHFRSFVFNKKILNILYIGEVTQNPSANIKAFISLRQGLDRNDAKQKDLYDKLSTYYFHYNPDLADLHEAARDYLHRQNLKTKWLRGDELLKHILGELNKYLSKNDVYDPYAVCMAIRIGLEKRIYDMLGEEQRKLFLEKHDTKSRIAYAESELVNVPENVQMLSVIFNEAAHLHEKENVEVQEKPIVYKLKHPVIRHIVEYVFDYEDTTLSLDKLH